MNLYHLKGTLFLSMPSMDILSSNSSKQLKLYVKKQLIGYDQVVKELISSSKFPYKKI